MRNEHIFFRFPAYPLDIAEEVRANVHSDLTVRVGSTKYSVPPEYVGLSVTVKISPFNVDIYHMGKLIWKHKRACILKIINM